MVAAVQAVKNLGDIGRGDTRAIVGNFEQNLRRTGTFATDDDFSVGSHKPDGIGNQIGKHLIQPIRINPDPYRLVDAILLFQAEPGVIDVGNIFLPNFIKPAAG